MRHRTIAALIAIALIVGTGTAIANDFAGWWSHADLNALWVAHPMMRIGGFVLVALCAVYVVWVVSAITNGRRLTKAASCRFRVVK
jgi:hypothetical protein